jgi:hypothetical protein
VRVASHTDRVESDPGQHIQAPTQSDRYPVKDYNGYTGKEREKKLRAMDKEHPGRTHPYYKGPCDLCGDPDSPVEPHTEDYSEPYLWERPAEYAVCRRCHNRIHSRFTYPMRWEAYKRHLRRGGYGSDLKNSAHSESVCRLAKELQQGPGFELEPMRQPSAPDAWWEKLKTDPATQTDPSSRPR